MLSKIEASQTSDIEFKTMVIRRLHELSTNYQKLQRNFEELTVNYISIKRDIETIKNGQGEMNKAISELKKTE